MPQSTRDYTDSEGESDSGARSHGAYEAAPSREGSPPIPPAPVAGPSEPHHPIRITLRPNLSHLVNDPTPLPQPASSDRSSLSPPPPITLRLNRPAASTVERAYSSSEEDRPSKRSKLSAKSPKSKSKSKSASSSTIAQAQPGGGSMPAPHRKAYDWLAPASASASHSGPPERRVGASGGGGSAPAESLSAGEGMDGEGDWKKSRSHKKRPADAPPGPGKAWRRGLKKGMQIPWRDGMTFMGEPGGPAIVHSGHGDGRREYSPDSSSDADDMDQTMEELPPPDQPSVLRPSTHENSSFALANSEELGIPIFKKPIVAPKIALSTFPKVTQFFAPINGGDPVFPRKERVRSWKHAEKSITGVGGGGLRVKTWAKGPASELTRIVQADREAREMARLAKKAAAADKAEASSESGRPPLLSTVSYDSTGGPSAADSGALPEMAGSEAGDEESVVGAEHSSPVAAPAKPKKKAKPRPKKSKLAQEIMPSTPDGEGGAAVDVLDADPIEA